MDITPGSYRITAVGALATGSPVLSAPIELDVERPDAPVSIAEYPGGPMELFVGEKTVLNVRENFSGEMNSTLLRLSQCLT